MGQEVCDSRLLRSAWKSRHVMTSISYGKCCEFPVCPRDSQPSSSNLENKVKTVSPGPLNTAGFVNVADQLLNSELWGVLKGNRRQDGKPRLLGCHMALPWPGTWAS